MDTKILMLCVAGVILLFSPPAHAYLDPATLGMAFQVVVAAIAASAVAIKLFWHKIRVLFGHKPPTLAAASSAQQPESEAVESTEDEPSGLS